MLGNEMFIAVIRSRGQHMRFAFSSLKILCRSQRSTTSAQPHEGTTSRAHVQHQQLPPPPCARPPGDTKWWYECPKSRSFRIH
jgi:hypothetical protein